jgi:putative ABC transport system permease protein
MLWFRLFVESLSFAWSAIWVNRLRTFLSLLGVMVGIFMISAVFAVVDSLEDSLKDTFNMLDEDVLFVQKWPWGTGGDYPWWKYVQRREPSIREAEALGERLSLAYAVAFQSSQMSNAASGNSRIDGIKLMAVTEQYPQVVSLDIARGRFFTAAEEAASRPLGIIGADVALALFGRLDVVGSHLTIRGLRIEIIGVFAQQGTSLLSDGMDRVVMVPAGFATRLMDIDEAGGSILVKAGSGVALDALRDEITQQYRQVRGVRPLEEDDFSINQVDMISSLLDEIFGQVEVGGWFIGIFAILVGCFSIANIMFVSVRERTRIIGVQKAIGAKSSFILMQFLFEAVALCLFGALFALAGVGLLVLGVNAMDLGMELHIRPERILLALGVAVASGLLAGLAPAQQAARMQPVEAMRMGA